MAEYLIQDTTLDAIADAINAKTGGSSAMTPAEMVTAIGSISGGETDRLKTAEVTLTQDYPIGTATARDLRSLIATAIGTNYWFATISDFPSGVEDKTAVFCTAVAFRSFHVPNLDGLDVDNGGVAYFARTYTTSALAGWYRDNTNCKAVAGTVYQVWGWD